VQLALQASAPLLAAATRHDGEHTYVDQWYARPAELSTEVGYVLRMPTGADADNEIGTLFEFDLTGRYAGISAVHAAMAARWFQLAKPEWLCKAIEAPVRPAPGGYTYVEASPDAEVVVLDVERERRRLIERIGSLADADKAALRAAWTPDLGNVQMPMTEAQVSAAHALVDTIDPFMATVAQSIERHPSNQARPEPLDLPAFDEGEPVDNADVLVLSEQWQRLPQSTTAALLDLRQQAQASGVDIHLGAFNSRRRFHITRAAMTLAVNDCLSDLGAVQGLAAFATGKDWPHQPGITLAQVVGHLGAAEAAAFDAAAGLLVNGLLVALVDEHGRFGFSEVPTPTTTNNPS
jgi:hypothetical protein